MKRLIFIVAALLMLSCTREALETGGYGTLSLIVKVSEQQDTKAVLTSEQLLASARINIYYADFSGLVRSYRYDQAPETIYLPAGSYRVDVEAGERVQENPVNPSVEQKSYAGSKEFTIKGDQTTRLTVEAGCNNVIARMLFDETLDQRFEDGYSLTLRLNGDVLQGRTVFPADVTELSASDNGKELFFLIDGLDEPELGWSFTGVLKKDGTILSKSGTIRAIEAGKKYELTLKYIVRDGQLESGFDIVLNATEECFDDILVFDAAASGILPSAIGEIWARHVIIHAAVADNQYDDCSDVTFEYAPSGSSDWTVVPSSMDDQGKFEATLTGLIPETTYIYRLLVKGEVVGNPAEFTTDIAPNVPNASFEYTTNTGKYHEWYNASAPEVAARKAWWGSGNGSKTADTNIGGSADKGFVICEPSSDSKDGLQSAYLKSTYAVVKLAAGNIFSGYFGGLDANNEGGKVYYGRPWEARPAALRFWAKYETGKVNRVSGYPADESNPKDKPDRARIYTAVGTWNYKTYGGTKECPILVNTTDQSTFYNYRTMVGTIAYGELILSGSNGGWVQYTIPYDYNNLMEKPTHILISCASSMLGDYFTGCDSSKLWLDKMELIYE